MINASKDREFFPTGGRREPSKLRTEMPCSVTSLMMKSAPLPVSTPPTEVASLKPFWVVRNSCTDCF